MTADNRFGTVLRQIRREQQVSQLALAVAIGGTGATYICRLERGRRRRPSAHFVGKIIAAFAELERRLAPDQRARLISAAFDVEHYDAAV